MISRNFQLRGRQLPATAGWGKSACALAVLSLLILTTPTIAEVPASQPSATDVESQYQAVLAEMRHPTATGILVTEIEPESPGGAAGLQAGDIIYHYAGSTVHDLDTLRRRLADQIAAKLTEPLAGTPGVEEVKVLLGVHRGDKDVILQVSRAPLGIRAIEVEAGAPANLNPPPSLRGSIVLAWADLAKMQPMDAAPAFYRTMDTTDTWTSWQRRTFVAGTDDFTVQFENHHVDPSTGEPVASEAVDLRVRTGDYSHEPAFLLDSLQETMHTPEGADILNNAERHGLSLRTQGKTSYPMRVLLRPATDVDCPLDSLPEPALPMVAAALPQDAGGAALQLHLLSLRDFVPRPGYLLISRGKQARDASNSASAAWRVDLLHCGVTIETFWFDDRRQLVQFDSPTAGLIARRVATAEEAATPAVQKVAETQQKP